MKKLMIKLASVVVCTGVAYAIDMAMSNPAYAWFTICNKSSSDVSVAFAYLDIPDSRERCSGEICSPLHPDNKVWNSQGWWNLSSGECAEVYPHELTKRNNYYYVYAKDNTYGGAWSGEQYFCTISSRFTLAKADEVCRGEWQGFSQVYTGNNRNYTYTLTD